MQAEATFAVTEGALKVRIDNEIELQFADDALETHFRPWQAKFDKAIARRMREDVEV